MGDVIIYFGFNNPIRYKRGVENVILAQSSALPSSLKYYIYFDASASGVFRWGNVVCVSIKKSNAWYLKLNVIVGYIIRKHRNKNIIIHSHHYLSSFFLFWKTDLFTIHDGLFYLSKHFGKPWHIVFSHYLIEKVVYWRTPILHFVSKFALMNSLMTRHSSEKIRLIPNTTILEKQKVTGVSSGTEGRVTILSVRSIEERAGIDLILMVAQHYQVTNPAVAFVIAGKGPLLAHYQALIESRALSNVVFIGFVSDEELAGRYAQADIILVTSLYGEGFGLPVIEGYLFDKPVLASNVCAIPEVIIAPEFLFENDPKDIITKLDSVMMGLMKKYQYAEYYQAEYSNHAVLSKYEALYRQVSGPSKRSDQSVKAV
jgi:glycosyltransferase involved in cell wall biosynthesis